MIGGFYGNIDTFCDDIAMFCGIIDRFCGIIDSLLIFSLLNFMTYLTII